MHGKVQPPSAKALEGRARKAARAAEKAAAAEAAAEAEEAARWQIGAPGKTAREARKEQGEAKGAARAEKREIERREGMDEGEIQEARKGLAEKEWKLEVKEAMLASTSMEEAVERMVETYSRKYFWAEEWKGGMFVVYVRWKGGEWEKEKVVIAEGRKKREEYEVYGEGMLEEREEKGEEEGRRRMGEQIYEEWMHKGASKGREERLLETQKELERVRGERRRIEPKKGG